VRQKRLTFEEAELHPRRNALLRSIGVDPEVEVDVQRVPLAAGDCFLLCSDGLWGEVDQETIAQVLISEEPERGARALVELANRAGGRDNITVALVAVGGAVDTLPLAPRPAAPRAGSPPARRHLRIATALLAGLAILVLTWLAFSAGG
jgi:protein phosphatase